SNPPSLPSLATSTSATPPNPVPQQPPFSPTAILPLNSSLWQYVNLSPVPSAMPPSSTLITLLSSSPSPANSSPLWPFTSPSSAAPTLSTSMPLSLPSPPALQSLRSTTPAETKRERVPRQVRLGA